MIMKRLLLLLTAAAFICGFRAASAEPEDLLKSGFVPLFNGKDLTGWKAPRADKSCWSVVGGVIDCEIPTPPPPPEKVDKSLWTVESFGDFVLHVDWRIKRHTGLFPMPIVLPDGSLKKDESGNVITVRRPNSDSGIVLRGASQVNIWCWPVGSGELENVRTNQLLPAAERAAAVPRIRADKPVGEWNTFRITLKGDRVSVVLNGHKVIDNARLTGGKATTLPARGPIGFQYHVGRNAEYGASSLVQFRNVYIKRLDKAGAPSTGRN